MVRRAGGDRLAVADAGRQRVAAALLLGLAAVFVGLRLTHLEFAYDVWSDRDMIRATYLPLWPPLGPELWYGVGARIPGGANQLLWGMALRVHDTPGAVLVAMWTLHVAGALAVGAVLRRHLGWLAAAVYVATAVSAVPALRTLSTLWNPGWTLGLAQLALAATLAGILGRRAVWSVPAGLALALALQTHLSAGLLGAVLVGAWASSRPPGWLRWAPAALVAFAVPYLPYVAHEVATGGANTAALLHPRQLATLSPGGESWAGRGEELVGILTQLGGASGWADPSVATALAVTLALLVALRAAPAGAPRSIAGLGVATVALTTIVYARSHADAGHAEQARYLATAVAAVPLVLSAAAASPARAVSWGVSLVAALTVGGAVRLHLTHLDRRMPDRWSELQAVADALVAHPPAGETSWDLEAALRRTAVVRGQSRFGTYSLTWPLWRTPGRTTPPSTGSGRPPCLLLVLHDSPHDPGRLTQPEFLAHALGSETIAHVDATILLDGTHTLLHYTPTSDWCPTDFEQRYFHAAELTGAEILPSVRPGEAVRVDDGVWAFSWQSRADKDDVWPAGWLRVRDGTVTLDVPALSGRGWNLGAYANAAIVAPTLVARDAAGAEVARVVVATGLVGGPGAHTPLSVTGSLPPYATLELTFTSDVSRIPWEDGAGRTDLAVPVNLTLR